MQTLFKGSKIKAKSLISGGKKLGSSIVGAAKNNIVGFNKVAESIVPQKKQEKENNFISNYTNFFGSKKTEKILRKNLKLVRDSLVNTFEIARHLKAAIVSITKDLKSKGGKGGGGLFGGLGGLFGFLGGITGLIGGLFGLLSNPLILAILGAGTIVGAIKLIFGDGDVEKYIRKYVKDILAATILPGANDNPNTNNLAMDNLIEDVGESRALAVMKGRMEELKEQRGWMKGNYFSEENKEIRDLEKKIEDLKTRGVVSADMSGGQYESDLANFSSETQTKKELKKEFHQKKTESIRAVRLRREKEMPQRLKDSMNKSISEHWHGVGLPDFHPEVQAYLKETRRQVLEAEEEIRQQYLPEIKGEKTSVKSSETTTKVTPENTLQNNVKGVQSDINNMNFENFYDDGSLDESKFSFAPITFNNAQAQDSSGGDVVNSSGGNGSSGNAVTFYSSSNSDPSYHKLNALMTFNIV